MIDETALKLLFHHVATPALAVRAAKDFLRQMDIIADHDRSSERPKGIHPSTLARCNRQAAMELEGVPRTNFRVPEAIRRAGEVGNAIHANLQAKYTRVAKKTKLFTFQDEVRLNTSGHPDVARYELQGSCDGIFGYNNRKLGLEIKGLSEDAYALIHQNTSLPGSTIPEFHLLQAAVYQHCLGLDAMMFLYVKRETLITSPKVVKIPDQYWHAMRRRASLILDLAIKDLMPPGTSTAYECTPCAYRPTCPEPINSVLPKAKVWECVHRLQEASRT